MISLSLAKKKEEDTDVAEEGDINQLLKMSFTTRGRDERRRTHFPSKCMAWMERTEEVQLCSLDG